VFELEVVMAAKKQETVTEATACPIGKLFSRLEKASRGKTQFMEHLSRSRIEFLKALKCLIDGYIEETEQKDRPRGQKKATRINIE
jgi:ribosomal protein S8